MGIWKGALTVRRYIVAGEVPDGFRDAYLDALNDRAFREKSNLEPGEEVAGWCLTQNLLDTDFSDRDRWLYNHFICAALRVDKKVLPAKYFKALLEKRIAAWCAENARERAPRNVKEEQKTLLQQELLQRVLPRVTTIEFVWNVADGWVLLHSTSESANDRFRKMFFETFGLPLVPFSPLDFLADDAGLLGALEIGGISDYRSADAPVSAESL
jgi:recombination associated protein RdgC